MSKDEEIRRVAAELDLRLGELRVTVGALNAILLPPEADPGMEKVLT